jgi:hypothetical protein
LRFIDAVECDNDEALWRISIKAREVLAADNKMTVLRLYRRHNLALFVENAGLESGFVVYFQNGDYNINWWLGLGMKPLNHRRTNSDAREN